MTAAIHTENVVKKFRRVNAVTNLNLDVSPGSVYALVGPNGAGKTTVIKILMNILRASSGRAEVLASTHRVSPAKSWPRSATSRKIRNCRSG